jgi:RND family efflux transporter MFP subunit
MDYRVDAPFQLRTEDEAFLAAPFDGFIEDVKVERGDEVKKGATLLTLDTRNLLLEEAAALADLTRYQREAEKARAASRLADMRIAEAEAEQSRVRLELARFHRSQAAVVAPFDGAVIEGDLKKRLAAPVKQGDMLFKIARTDRIYAEAAVSEMDIHELREGAPGEVAFASLPKRAFPVRIERIEPAAQAKEDGNVFVVRCRFEGAREPWWRSGMTGVAKLQAGRRNLLWVATHRTVDVLRMFFWW